MDSFVIAPDKLARLAALLMARGTPMREAIYEAHELYDRCVEFTGVLEEHRRDAQQKERLHYLSTMEWRRQTEKTLLDQGWCPKPLAPNPPTRSTLERQRRAAKGEVDRLNKAVAQAAELENAALAHEKSVRRRKRKK